MEDFVGSLIGGEIMDISTVIENAGTVIEASVTTLGKLSTAVPFILLPAAFKFGGKLIGMAKSMVFAGGRRRR